ncbi:mitochondrial substrate carrier family protein B [Selaginella moellendorffii]|uniref:mitochondrial substrate carrier family protein B n=1 Tax=Selaginella moellendorffii TaxID=88036 RepID=UPI000D1CD39D|nr:mitochondrial substrate carrier family protein B [Selaginella moellendorffii]|eukprot:XP_024527762.1 mitochondrial substrate carrier family protein B [Selaginella moellendorffii]
MAVSTSAAVDTSAFSSVPTGSSGDKAVEGVLASQQGTSQIGSLSQLAAGGIAGAVSKTCTAPLARLTILFQIRGMTTDKILTKPSILREAARILREEGGLAFWKGNGVTIVHRLPYSAINFYSYEQYKAALLKWLGVESSGDDNSGARLLARFVAGGGAGITAAATTYPLDLVRTRLAAQTTSKHYTGIYHAISTIHQQESFLGLYKGLWPTLLSVGPTIAINFCVYETLYNYWNAQRPESSRMVTSLISGGVAGIAASTAVFPIDLVKRRMQLEGDRRWTPAYKPGIVSALRHIVRTQGYAGLYRGILPEYLKVFPGVGIAFMVYEVMKNISVAREKR